MKDIIIRLKQLIDEKGLTPYQLEMALGVSRGVFSKKFNGQFTDFKLSNMQKLGKKYPEIDFNWLIKGTPKREICAEKPILESNNSENIAKLLAIIERQQGTIEVLSEIANRLTNKKNVFSNIAAEGE